MVLLKKIKIFINTIIYCFLLSWRSSRFYTFYRIIEKIIVPVLNIFTIYLSKYMINIFSGEYKVENKKVAIIILLSFILFINVIKMTLQKVDQYILNMHNDILRKDISLKMMERSVTADIEFFDNAQFFDSFEAVRRDMYSVTEVIWHSIDCFGSLVTFVYTFFIVCDINIFYALAIVIAVIPSAIISKKYTKELYQLSLVQMNDERNLNYLYAVTTGKMFAEDIRLFHIGDMIKTKYIGIWNRLFANRKNTNKKNTILSVFIDTLPEIVSFVIMLLLSFKILNGYATLGDYSFYFGVTTQLSGSVFILFISAIYIYDDNLRINNVKSFEKVKNKIVNEGIKILNTVNKIEFNKVSFSYPSTELEVLTDISFSIEKGEKAVLVGVNGAGKSTIIKLLLRFYDVNKGEILINGINIKEYELHNYRRAFSSSFQKSTIYGFSLRENIVIGDYDSFQKNDDEVLKVLELSGAMGILNKANKGLDTFLTRYLDNDGMELSGGENQKIAIARSFYRNSEVLILDEPSSSLDPESEYEIFQTINKLCENKTTLLTSHRLSNISVTDKIIVIEEGKIIEQGTHETLMSNQQKYAILYNYQCDKFKINN